MLDSVSKPGLAALAALRSSSRQHRWALLALALIFVTTRALATVVQVDGTIIPVMGGTVCAGNLQVCFDNEPGAGAGTTIDAVLDAATLPEAVSYTHLTLPTTPYV